MIQEVLSMCKNSITLNDKPCDNEDFWQARLIQDVGPPDLTPENWRQAYMNMVQFYINPTKQ